MRSIFRRPSSQVVLPLLAVFVDSLALIFLVLRLSAPSDGARLAFDSELSTPGAVSVYPLIEYPDSLQSGDQVIRVDGHDVSDWTRAIFHPPVSYAGWEFGDTVAYTVQRRGEQVNVPVALGRLPVDILLSKNAPTVVFLMLMHIQALWMWWQRRGETATQTLLLAASAFVSFSLCWYISMDLAALVNSIELFLFYRVITFVQLMIMSAALIHFALVLPRPNGSGGYTRRFIALIYLVPYPVYLLFLLATYTPDALAWLRRWEFGAIGLIFLSFVLTLLALISGYRRMTTPGLRPRVRVVMAALTLAIVIATLVGIAPALLTGQLALEWQVVPLLSLPVALGIGIAVVFFRLFDLRVVIQRTLVWTTLTALIIAIYVLVVGTLSALFQTRSSPIFSLIATGIIAIIFAAVRLRLQQAVSWLLYGERDTPYQVIARLSHRLEQTLTPDDALAQVAQTVAVALRLPYAAVELCQGGRYVCMASWGEAGEERIEYPFSYGGETAGRLVVTPRSPGESLTSGDHQLLTDLLYHAESATQAARLYADLQRSRENLVMTREEERRRLRRDLHDGLGPALASLSLQIDAARNLLTGEPDQVDALLVDIKAQIGGVLTDIRRLVYELRPPALDQLGLRAAICEKARELERASGVRINVETPVTLPTLSAAAEVALYRICLEALTNVIRHAGATTCVVRLTCNHALRLEVSDNGCGLPETFQRGVGLNSMMERASELGGSCLVERVEDGGTRVFAQLPLDKLAYLEGVP